MPESWPAAVCLILLANSDSCVHVGISASVVVMHSPRTDKSGFNREESSGLSVHGRMYTQSILAFSSGENNGLGTLAKDQVGMYGRRRFSQHQRCRNEHDAKMSGNRMRSESSVAM